MLHSTCVSLRFYRPLWNQGIHKWQQRRGVFGGNQPAMWKYQRKAPPTGHPTPDAPVNKIRSRQQIVTNPIPGLHGFVTQRAANGYPERDPVPEGIARSWASYDNFMYKYFPDEECALVLDSVLNNRTKMPMFMVNSEMSKPEIVAYLRNVYGMAGIRDVITRNFAGLRYKNELGVIKKFPAKKAVWVILEEETEVLYKSVKEGEGVD
eukprot:PhM_4_TR8127/c0_g1_i1/m.18201